MVCQECSHPFSNGIFVDNNIQEVVYDKHYACSVYLVIHKNVLCIMNHSYIILYYYIQCKLYIHTYIPESIKAKLKGGTGSKIKSSVCRQSLLYGRCGLPDPHMTGQALVLCPQLAYRCRGLFVSLHMLIDIIRNDNIRYHADRLLYTYYLV